MGIVESYVRFTLRIPESLRDELLKTANQNHRSLNSQIIVMLEKALEEPSPENDEVQPE